MEENREIGSEIRMTVNYYLQNYHPKGWNLIDRAKKYIDQNHYLIEAPIQDLTFVSCRYIVFSPKKQPPIA